jgi:acyl-CoA thioesterase
MPPAIGQKLGPGARAFMAPSCDLTVHFLAPTRDEWLLAQVRCNHAGEGYASATVHLWDRERRLVAFATQMMYMRLDPPDPS